jgi:hypothetical protein
MGFPDPSREVNTACFDSVLGLPHLPDRSKEGHGVSDAPFKIGLTPDGRFVFLEESGVSEAPVQIEVVVNWFQELEKRVPVSR